MVTLAANREAMAHLEGLFEVSPRRACNVLGVNREERLHVHRRGGRKRALGTRSPMAIPQGRNQRWSKERDVAWHYIAPGKPQQKGFIERLASPPFGSMPHDS